MSAELDGTVGVVAVDEPVAVVRMRKLPDEPRVAVWKVQRGRQSQLSIGMN
jgi:hypothetical protein